MRKRGKGGTEEGREERKEEGREREESRGIIERKYITI